MSQPKKITIIIDPTLGNFGKSRYNTRRSFGGFNPFIEKLNDKIKKGQIKFHTKRRRNKKSKKGNMKSRNCKITKLHQ